MGELVGFSQEGVMSLAHSVDSCASESASVIVDDLRDGFVVPMSEAWYTPTGVEYFKELAETVKGYSKNITDVFNEYIEILRQVERKWAENTGKESMAASIPDVSALTLNLDISSIKDSLESKNGIYPAEAQAVANKLPQLKAKIDDDLNRISNELVKDAAFIGAGQEEAVGNCFKIVEDLVGKLFDSLETEVPNQLKTAIDNYQSFATSVSDSLNNTQVG